MRSLSVLPVRTRSRLEGERGATAVEYSIIASLIAAVVAGTVALLGTTVLGLFQSLPFP
jgi:pilus assembly protein Flp/PilA